MTLALAGTIAPTITGLTFPLTPHAVGDVVVIEVISTTSADHPTALSSSNVTWDPSPVSGPTVLGSDVATVFKGKATAASLATVTVTTNTGTPTIRVGGAEVSTTAGYANVLLDTVGTVAATTTLYPLLQPGRPGEFYFGYAFATSTTTAGSTSGYTYALDPNGNGMCANASCSAGPQQPTWPSDGYFGIAVLLYEAVSPFTSPAKPVRGRPAARRARLASLAALSAALPGVPSHFTLPVKPVKGKPSARKGRSASSAGSPVVLPVPGLGLLRTEGGGLLRTEGGGRFLVEGAVTPSPFAPPAKPVRGKPAARKGRLSAPAPSPAAAAAPATPSPFTPPTRPARGKSAARKARLASSPGSPVVIPSPFAVPAKPTRGKRAAGKSRAAFSAGSPLVLPPPVPSPFAAPAKPARGKSAANKGRLASSPGSPVVPPPPITPSPFVPPVVPVRSKGILRKGRFASSPGAPVVLPPSPFTLPAKPTRGRAAARKARLASSPGSPAAVPSSPFALPTAPKRGKPAARKARTAFSAGSPLVLPGVIPSPFTIPSKPARGRPAAARARFRSSPGSPAVVPGWTIIGTMAQTATSALALIPAHIGDLIFVDVVSVGAPPAGISGGGCTWQQVGTTLTGVTNAGDYAAAYEGTVITTGSATATLAFTGTPTTIRAVAQEAQSSTGAWIVDGPQGNLDSSGTNTLPSLLPTASGDLYIGYTFDNSTATAGTTPGYTYDIDAHGNGLAFNPSCTAAAQAPVWGTSTCAIGISVLFKAVVPSPPATPSVFSVPAKAVRGKASARKARTAFSAGSPAVVAPPPPPFPQSPLDLRCELNLAGTWTDVSGYAYQRTGEQAPVTITRGKPDESSTANPASCTWQLNNRDGRFSPRNPLSPYYGQLIRNTPVRWSVPAARSYLRLEANNRDRAYVNDNPNIDITGSIDIRIGLRLTDWQGCVLAHKWDGGTCWYWQLNDDGTMTFGWWDGSAGHAVTSSQPVPFTPGAFALRATMDAATGNVTFYTAAAIGGTWAQLGSVSSGTGGASTAIATASGSALTTGYSFSLSPAQMFGSVHELQLYNGIAGTLAADGIFTAQSAGATSWTDPQGNPWNLAGGAEISDRDYRFHGEMSQMPPKWDVTGNDMWVAAQAGGPLRRLGQGTNNALSAMKRAILLQTGAFVPVAYWPMEDAAGASVFGSATGGAPVTFDASPAPTLSSDSSFTASAPLPQLNGSRLQAPVPPYTDTGTWTVRFLLKVSPPAADATLIRIVASPWAACPVLYVNTDTAGNLEFIGYNQSGGEAFNTGYFSFGATSPLWCSVEAQAVSGGNVQYSLVTVAPGASSGFALTETVSGSAGTVSLVQPDVTGAFTDTVMGHLQVQSAWQSLFALSQPLNAWTGETAAARYARLCAENGYQSRIIGPAAVSVAMGAQGQGTLDALLKECEAADLGQQFEPRQQLALGYRTLASMCSQSPALELDYAASEPGGVNGSGDDNGLDPAYDDQLSKNDWTVTRGGVSGSQGATVQVQLTDGSAMSVGAPPDGMGDYANTATVNVEYDDQLQDVAGWMVHAGTVDDLRWPLIPVNLARPEMAALQQDAVDLDIGDMVQVDDAPDAVIYDPVKQVVLGMKESLGGFHWTHEYNAVPESVYEVVILGDPVHGRADTDGSQLAVAAAYPQSSLSVETTGPSGILWTTAAADFPFDINVSGMRLTVTNITGSSSPQAFTVTPAVNGVEKTLPAGTDVRLWFPPILALT